MFFKKSKHKTFAKIIIASPEEITKGNPLAKIWTQQEKLFFDLELSFLMFFISAPKLKKENMMLIEKELVSSLTNTAPNKICSVDSAFLDIIRNRFQQYGNACRNDKENNYAKALETVFFGFYEIDRRENILEVVKDDLSAKLSITAAPNRLIFVEALSKIYAIVEKKANV